MNGALFLGFFRWLLRPQTGTWQRTDRLARGSISPAPAVPAVVVGSAGPGVGDGSVPSEGFQPVGGGR